MALLINSGADMNAETKRGYNPLIAACALGHLACMRVLLGRGADVNYETRFGHTPLLRAAAEGRAVCVEELVAAGASESPCFPTQNEWMKLLLHKFHVVLSILTLVGC